METENKTENSPILKKKKDTLFTVLITEVVYISIILAAVLIIKYFLPSIYGEVKKWYENNFLTETTVSEVIEESGKDEV